jgi:hypothetical protein
MTQEPGGATPRSVRAALVAGEWERARDEVRRAFAGGAPADDGWADAAEAVGLADLAVQAWRAVVARQPDRTEAWEALARLHELRGDERRAAECRRRLGSATPPVEPVAEDRPDAPAGVGSASGGDLVRFVHRFAGRGGVHARMWRRDAEVGYAPVQAPLEPGLVAAHLRGDVTVGSYLVRHGDLCAQLVFDLDARREAVEAAVGDPDRVRDLADRVAREGVRLSAVLRAAGMPHLLFDSGYKGRHLWVFLDPPAPAAQVRAVGLAWATALASPDPDLAIEVFPKQAQVPAGGLGNLVKLPLGVHLRTGRRCALLDDAGAPVADPWPALRAVPAVPVVSLPAPPSIGAPPPSPSLPARSEVALPAAPVAAALPFTEADWEARPRLAAVMTGCAVLRDVVRRAAAERRLVHDERLALEHTLGHYPEGVEAIGWLLDRVGATEPRMGRPHQGSPLSCKGMRRRLPTVADRVGCDCPLEDPSTYPNPLLHARHVPAAAATAPPDLDELLDRLGRLEARARAVADELRALRSAAVAALAAAPGGRHRTEAGEWSVEEAEGVPWVRFSPAAGAR